MSKVGTKEKNFQSLLGFITKDWKSSGNRCWLSIPFGIYHMEINNVLACYLINFQSLLGFIAFVTNATGLYWVCSFNPFWDLSSDVPAEKKREVLFQSLLGFIERPEEVLKGKRCTFNPFWDLSSVNSY